MTGVQTCALPILRATVRVHTPKVVGMDPERILISIKIHIPKAVAVRVLYSSNIEVILPN